MTDLLCWMNEIARLVVANVRGADLNGLHINLVVEGHLESLLDGAEREGEAA